jgi:Tfp pilus assembly protein PilO
MLKNFKLPSTFKFGALPLGALKDTQIQVRIVLGVLLLANIVAAGFAFHFFDDSPDKIAQQVTSARQQVLAQVVTLNRSRTLAGKVDKGREDGTRFISTYMTSRRATYSTIISEIDNMAAQSAMKRKDAVITLEAVKGSDTIDKMTVTASFEGPYRNLLNMINLIDKSKRFLIIESLGATPQQGGTLQVTMKINTFVNEEANNNI